MKGTSVLSEPRVGCREQFWLRFASSLHQIRGTHIRFQLQTCVLEKACTDTVGGNGGFLDICLGISKQLIFHMAINYCFCEFSSTGANPQEETRMVAGLGNRVQTHSTVYAIGSSLCFVIHEFTDSFNKLINLPSCLLGTGITKVSKTQAVRSNHSSSPFIQQTVHSYKVQGPAQ